MEQVVIYRYSIRVPNNLCTSSPIPACSSTTPLFHSPGATAGRLLNVCASTTITNPRPKLPLSFPGHERDQKRKLRVSRLRGKPSHGVSRPRSRLALEVPVELPIQLQGGVESPKLFVIEVADTDGLARVHIFLLRKKTERTGTTSA